MSIYVVEIDARPIAAFAADSMEAAASFCRQTWFQTNLTIYEHDGQPLWDGADKLELRLAFPEEAAIFESSLIQGLSRNEKSEHGWVCFLLSITDPADDPWDDEDDEVDALPPD